MTGETSTHWTDDDELLARFVLGRVAPEEGADLEQHLAWCERCRGKVDHERLLVAGIRKLGREELRRSLAGRVRAHPPRLVPWPRILAAAAVIVIVGGIAIIGRWLAVQETIIQRVTEQPAVSTPGDSFGTSTSGPVAPAEALRGGEEKEAGKRDKGPVADRGRKDEERIMERTKEEAAESEEAGRAEAFAPQTTPPAKAGGAEGDIWWVGRHVILGGPGDSLMQDVQPAARLEGRPTGKSDAPTRKAGAITLAQRPLAALPADRREAPGDGSEIQIRGERRGGTILLTLYVEPLFDPLLFDAADIKEIGSDSLEVTIGDHVIGIRLPAGLK